MPEKPTYEELQQRILRLEQVESDRKAMEEALRKSEEEYRALGDCLPVGVMLISPNMEIMAVNAAHRKWFPDIDYTQHPTCYSTHDDPLRTEPCQGCPVIKTFQDGQVHTAEMNANTSLGIRTMFSTATPLFDSGGKVISVHETVVDITERKLAEEKLRKSEASLAEAQRIASIGNWDFDILNNTLDWSDEIYRIFGYKPQEFEASNELFLSFIHPDDRELVRRSVEEALKGRKPYSIDHRIVLPDGTQRIVHEQAHIMRDENGNPMRMHGTVHDITERKQAEEEKTLLEKKYHQAQKMESVGRLAGGVAHDFNNMLGVIIGHAELALEQTDPSEPLHAHLTEIQQAAGRSADLAKQLLTFARKQTIAPRLLDLNQTIISMLNMLQRLIGEDIDLSWQPGEGVWPVRMDPSQIDQLLINLCVNARDAIKGVGRVTIETGNTTVDQSFCAEHQGSTPGEYVLLTVSDNGCGMDKKTLDKLFEPFFTTKELGKGTGLGLATVYGIVKQNKGFIYAHSEPGKGSIFRIYLPRPADWAEETPEEKRQEPARCGHETILLVEDNPAILNMTVKMLERQGYTVLPASTPQEAISLTETHSGEIHLLMTDVVMPDMNGRDLARKIVSSCANLKCLFMSGYPDNVIACRGVLEKKMNFIQKPFSMRDLTSKVREVLDD